MLAWTVRSWRIIGSGGGRSLWPQQPKIYPTLPEPACAKTPIPQMFQKVSVCGRKLATLPGSARALEIGPKIVVAGKSYDMPRGDLTSDGEAGTRPRTIPRRTLIGDAALNRIKVGPGAPLKSDPVLGRPATPDDVRQPDPLALPDTVTIKCPTNSANGSTPPDIHGAATPNRLAVVTGLFNALSERNVAAAP